MNSTEQFSIEALQHKIDTRTKPVGSLGMLERIALKVGTIQQTLSPELTKPALLLFSADHGIAAEGVSPCPTSITWQQTINFARGGGGCSTLSAQNGIKLRVIDMGVDYDFDPAEKIESHKIGRGTKNMMLEPAMSIEECEHAMAIGAQCVAEEHEQGCNVIGFGEMGIGNTSPSSLLIHHFIGVSLVDCVGPGSGLNRNGVNHKLQVLTEVYEKYNPTTPLEALATFGGYEMAAICGAALEAYKRGMVIIVDGFIISAAILTAQMMEPKLKDNLLFAHLSNEKAHGEIIKYFGGEPILQLDLRLGEGTGMAIAYPVVQSAMTFLNKMKSFDEAEVFEVGKILDD